MFLKSHVVFKSIWILASLQQRHSAYFSNPINKHTQSQTVTITPSQRRHMTDKTDEIAFMAYKDKSAHWSRNRQKQTLLSRQKCDNMKSQKEFQYELRVVLTTFTILYTSSCDVAHGRWLPSSLFCRQLLQLLHGPCCLALIASSHRIPAVK